MVNVSLNVRPSENCQPPIQLSQQQLEAIRANYDKDALDAVSGAGF
jgi:hypothetical protein